MTNRSATERPHVLIVSEDTDLSAFFGEGLVYAGFWTSTIAGAIQALEVFRLRTFDLMIVDATLGGLGTRELVRRLRANEAGGRARADIPILVVADSAEDAAASELDSLGVDGVLLPPIDLEELAPRLFGMVDAWRAEHPGRPYADYAGKDPIARADGTAGPTSGQ